MKWWKLVLESAFMGVLVTFAWWTGDIVLGRTDYYIAIAVAGAICYGLGKTAE